MSKSKKSKKAWSGRFKKEISQTAEAFTSSIAYDKRLLKYDILGSIAQAEALQKVGVLKGNESRQIIQALHTIQEEIDSGKTHLRDELEDIHMNVEELLVKKVGELGKKLHTGRSRNDQVVTDLRLFVKDALSDIRGLIVKTQSEFVHLAEKYQDVFAPSYTHLQRAQPILLSHYYLAYYEMLERDKTRLDEAFKRVDVLPLGSGAVAGSGFKVDREMMAKKLGFAAVSANSIDAVSDRDFVVDVLSAAALSMMHLSRFCEELVLWTTEEFRFIELSEEFSTGSSLMPQKKNPDVAELIRGKTGRIYGNLIQMLTTLKGLPLSYNRDLQEDKEGLFDTYDTWRGSLKSLYEMLKGMRINRDVLESAALKGHTTATDLADYLVRRGVPFREAHRIVGRIVSYAITERKELKDLSLMELRRFYGKIGEDVYKSITVEESLAARDVIGGTAPVRVRQAIAAAKEKLK